MSRDIKSFIRSNLLGPMKEYPTIIQDTMVDMIVNKMQQLYDFSFEFPEIISPTKSRLDILRTIAEQFLFTIREDADIEEQINILSNILYVYKKRGSIDTIENMWKYYGGELPKDVKVIIPSYNLFRYSISRLSGNHVFQDNLTNRAGVYEIRVTNNTYPIPDLRDFLLEELVAAGNYIYFTNSLHMNISSKDIESNPYKYIINEETLVNIQLDILKAHQGFTWSGYNTLSSKDGDSSWSGKSNIYLELINMIDIGTVAIGSIIPYEELGFVVVNYVRPSEISYSILINTNNLLEINQFLYSTPINQTITIARYLYNSHDEPITSEYPGYFILGRTLLREEVL